MNATTDTAIMPALASTPAGMKTCRHARESFDRASMIELTTFGRLFWAAINSRPGSGEPYDEARSKQSDDEMNVLAAFDDEISIRIVEREPRDAEERGAKASYLIARLRCDNMSEAATDRSQQWIENAAMGIV